MRWRAAVLGTAIGVTVGVGASRARRWWKTWGIDPAEATKALPGDELVTNPVGGETRGITIEAPPSAVWPWLVQMGYGRAGWYSYDQLDQRGKSVDTIVEAWQALKVGDIVPTHPTGGFEVAIMDPGRALVLRSDTALVRAQAEAAKTTGEGDKGTAGIQASGAILGSTPQDFAASWAFVLEPVGERHTRLVERFRVWFGAPSRGSKVTMPFLGFGVFVMMQRQMEGIRTRAERLAARALPPGLPLSVPDATGKSAPAERAASSVPGDDHPAPEPELVGTAG